MSPPTLHFISGVATPPVNLLLAVLAARSDLRLRLWYAEETDARLYPWQANPTHEVLRAEIYGRRWPSPRVSRLALTGGGDGLMVVGWSNPTTRLLLPLLAARGRRFAFFADRPADKQRSLPARLARGLFLGILRRHSTVFGLGRTAVQYFADQGLPPERLCNLPLPVELPATIRSRLPPRDAIRSRFTLGPSDVFLVTGSRLVPSKGFDLLLVAVGGLAEEDRARLKLLIVGSGPEQERLAALAKRHDLGGIVRFEPWMEFVDFCGAIAAADLVVHPARNDPFGGITLTAVGLGVPVIGSRQAGSAVELIEEGRSGFLYEATDTQTLADRLRRLLHDAELRAAMASAARGVAARWTAERLADTLVARLFQDGILRA
jgi:glycosyltransferase involved in cell wall biosynthesis